MRLEFRRVPGLLQCTNEFDKYLMEIFSRAGNHGNRLLEVSASGLSEACASHLLGT